MPKQFNLTKWIISSTLKALVLAFVVTLILGYMLGFRVFLVNGWSAQPIIKYQSIILTKSVKVEDLKIGDLITFGKNTYTTHQVVRINYEEKYVICQGFQYDEAIGEYKYQNTTQFVEENKIMGKVIGSSYSLGRLFVTIKNNPFIIIAAIVGVVFCMYFKNQYSTEPEFC